MRLPLITPKELTKEQRSLYDTFLKGMPSSFDAFQVKQKDGALLGPWNACLHEPRIGKAIWDLMSAISADASLPSDVQQIAILVVGANFNAAYEIYAHVAVAEQEGMKPEVLAPLVAGLKPAGLSTEESIAYDFSYALMRGGVLPEFLYRRATATFGQHGTNDLIYLTGLYCFISIMLNAYDVAVPEHQIMHKI